MASLKEDLIADLTVELQISDENFNADLLAVKVGNAIREVKVARCYPASYTSAMVDADMENYYSHIRDIALYDYNQLGAEFQTSSNENSVSRQWVSRDSLFNGIIGISKM